MTANEFRELALSFAGAAEHSHMHHPDFRAHGRIFATLGYPDKTWGMVKLSPEEQRRMVEKHPHAFVPVKGAWGLQGCTNVRLASAQPDNLAEAMESAWQLSAAPTKPSRQRKKTAPLA